MIHIAALRDLKRLGLDAFLNLNDGEGWMLPDTLCLADYGLGHDDRAKEPQPVAARIGAENAKLWEASIPPNPHSPLPIHAKYRFLPWQLEGTPEDSWAECDRHAENLRRLLGTPQEGSRAEEQSSTPDPNGQLNLIPPDEEQLRLF